MVIILKSSHTFLRSCSKIIAQNKYKQVRLNSYFSSPLIQNVDVKTKYEISKSPEDWKFVERILPPITVPPLSPKEEYHSGFQPPFANSENLQPYFIHRTKNHMIPVYLEVKRRGDTKLTVLRKIQGDIFALGKELENFVQPMNKKPIRMQVNEFSGIITIVGDYVNALKYWVQVKGF